MRRLCRSPIGSKLVDIACGQAIAEARRLSEQRKKAARQMSFAEAKRRLLARETKPC